MKNTTANPTGLEWKTLAFISLALLLLGCTINIPQPTRIAMEKTRGDITVWLSPAKFADNFSFEADGAFENIIAQAGNTLVILNFTIRGEGNYPSLIASNMFKIRNATGYDGYEQVLPKTSRFPNSTTLAYGTRFSDTLVFEVPKDSKNLQLVFTHGEKQTRLSSKTTYEMPFNLDNSK